MIEITPRKPVDEERQMMYLSGYDPSDCMVCYRLNGIMTIMSMSDGSIHRIDERIKREVP